MTSHFQIIGGMTTPKNDSINIKRLMSTGEGRWIIVPFFIVIVALIATALILGLLSLSWLPGWVTSAPAGVAVLLYYVVQVRSLFRDSPTLRLNIMNKSDGVAEQKNSDRSVAPVIKGDNNQITVIHEASPQTRKRSRKEDPD